MSTDEIVAPYGYSPWWLVLGVGLVAVVVLWWVLLLRAHRRGRAPRPAPVTPVPVERTGALDPWADARDRALGAIEELGGRYRAGSAAPRTVHQELATIVRDFAGERTGVDARTLTLHELRRHDALAPAAHVVAQLYAPEFATGAAATVSPEHALQQARETVRAW